MKNAIHRTPCLETASQDAAERPGELHARRQLHPGRSAGTAQLLRLRRLQFRRHRQQRRRGPPDREWIVGGEPSTIWDVDIRRFAPFNGNRSALAERTGETLGLHYAMRWPRQELETARPLRTLAAVRHAEGEGRGIRQQERWERANYFRPRGRAARAYTLGTPGWLPWVIEEQRAPASRRATTRPPSASCCCRAATRWRCCSALRERMDVPVGRMVYTPMLNARGGIETDLTVMRQARPLPAGHGVGATDARRRLDQRHIDAR